MNLLDHTLLLLVRALVKDEGHGGVPGGLQDRVPQTPGIEAVVPLGEVAGAVGPLRRRPDLSGVHAATTAKPKSSRDQSPSFHCSSLGKKFYT